MTATNAYCKTCWVKWEYEPDTPESAGIKAREHAKRSRGHQVVIHTYKDA